MELVLTGPEKQQDADISAANAHWCEHQRWKLQMVQ